MEFTNPTIDRLLLLSQQMKTDITALENSISVPGFSVANSASLKETISAYDFIYLPPQSFSVSGLITISKPTVIYGPGATLNWGADTDDPSGIRIVSSNVTICGVTLDGPQYLTSAGTQHGIYAYGADSSNYISNINIQNCIFTNWGFYGIYLKYVSNFKANFNRITNCYYGGIVGLSCEHGSMSINDINNIVATPNAYGIMASRDTSDSLVTDPRSDNIDIIGNTIRNVVYWEGIDTHAGSNITIYGNRVLGCKHGIVATPANDASAEATWAPIGITIVGNTIDSQVTDGTAGSGIIFTGAHDGTSTVNEYGTGTISGNTVKGYGLESNTLGNAVYIHTTQGLTVTGNTIQDSGNTGILMSHDNVGFSVTGNTIVDVWSETYTDPKGIDFNDVNNVGYVGGNNFYTGDKSATYKNIYAIYIANSSGTYITLGLNQVTGFTQILNDVGDKAIIGAVTGWTTSGTGEDDLASTVIPGGAFTGNGKMRVVAYGQRTGSAGNKTIKFYIGATATTLVTANSTLNWTFEAIIYGKGTTNSQGIMWRYMAGDGTGGYGNSFTETTIDTTSDFTIKMTAECADAGDTVTQKFWHIERLV